MEQIRDTYSEVEDRIKTTLDFIKEFRRKQ
jgi:hypothetical protein